MLDCESLHQSVGVSSPAQVGDGPVHIYSGQRLNPLDQQRARLRDTLREMGRSRKQLTYHTDYLHADGMGESEVTALGSLIQMLSLDRLSEGGLVFASYCAAGAAAS